MRMDLRMPATQRMRLCESLQLRTPAREIKNKDFLPNPTPRDAGELTHSSSITPSFVTGGRDEEVKKKK